VIPTYGVEQYLPEFLASLGAQTLPLDQLQLVFVDDGSPDRSSEMIRDWCADHAPHAVVLSKENGGLASARNAGLEVVTAEWVSFPDPDDVFEKNYFREVCRFLDGPGRNGVDLLATRLLLLDDATGEVTDSHPLRRKFRRGTQVVDLSRHPEYIHLQSATAFYRTEELARLGLTFDHTIKPNFEDAYLTSLYLAERERPRVGIVTEARYYYRKREDGSSLVQSSWGKPEKYTVLPEVGYLRLLEAISMRRGCVPVWAQNLVLYDLLFYFRQDERIHSATAWVDPTVSDPFHHLVRRILDHVDEETIAGFSILPTSMQLRQALLIGYKGVGLRPASLPLIRVDVGREIVQVRYWFGGDLPTEEFRVRGMPIEPVYAKIRDVPYLGRVLLRERIVWLPATGTVRIALDGKAVPLILGTPAEPVYVMRPAAMWGRLTKYSGPAATRAPIPAPAAAHPTLKHRARRIAGRTARSAQARVRGRSQRWSPEARRRRADERLVAKAASHKVRARYANAWTFIDRDNQAQDNAEHLYRHVRQAHPEVNAWFVLSRSSTDWDRLTAEGFRLVDYGSEEHTLLLLNTVQLLSSQVDHYIVKPLDSKRFRTRWRFTFLQHGVTKDDLSRWVNGKPISLFITASTDEHASLVGDHTPYIYTEKEVQLTGFPRHDRLLRLARESAERRKLLVMPTWRRTLLGETLNAAGGNARALREGFWESGYAQNWMSVLESDRLREIAQEHDLDIVFMPHPNMQGYLDDAPLPEHITVSRYSDTDVQEVLAESALMVTDYSSLAFEMAYIERPVVYFQFDQDEFFAGGHAYRRGTWSYEDDGFGPVTLDSEGALVAIAEAVAAGPVPTPPYAARMADIFPYRDGLCSERVYQCVLAMETPLTYEEGYRPLTVAGRPARVDGQGRIEPDASADTDVAEDATSEPEDVQEVDPGGEVIDELAAAVDR
jgi:glycosyltransferase involved in cell wall biosynthesis/CDP-glycerol glycerophosphotransferase (TagB/SpsB family)